MHVLLDSIENIKNHLIFSSHLGLWLSPRSQLGKHSIVLLYAAFQGLNGFLNSLRFFLSVRFEYNWAIANINTLYKCTAVTCTYSKLTANNIHLRYGNGSFCNACESSIYFIWTTQVYLYYQLAYIREFNKNNLMRGKKKKNFKTDAIMRCIICNKLCK